MNQEIKALRRYVRVQGMILYILLAGWLLQATPVMSLAKATILETFMNRQVPGRSEILARWSSRNGRATKVTTQSFDVIKAKEVQIENGAGQIVARLFADNKNDGGLFINDSKGDLATVVTVDDSGGGEMAIFGPGSIGGTVYLNGKRVGGDVTVTSNDVTMGIGIDDDTGRGIIAGNHVGGGLSAMVSGELGPGLIIRAKNGASTSLLTDLDGNVGLSMMDKQENTNCFLSGGNTSSLILGGGRFRAGVNSNGKGIAETRDANNTLTWSSEDANMNSSGLRGDLDNDGDVDFQDFLVFVDQFGKTTDG